VRFIYFEINMEARRSTYFGRNFALLKYFTHHLLLVPRLASNYKQHILSPVKLVFFQCRNMQTNNNGVVLMSQPIFFCIIMPTKGIIALGATFHTVYLPVL
jgi:hypothetical protein